jgi:hypothetical protein
MRSLLVAATLGLGLLSAGTIPGTAAATPYSAMRPAGLAEQVAPISPLHYQLGYHHRDYRPRYAPPPHHWHGYGRPRHDHFSRHHRPYGYGPRYSYQDGPRYSNQHGSRY